MSDQDKIDDDDGIKCDVTGLPATERELASIDPADELELPVGWLAITVARRRPNPEYLLLMQTMEMEIQGALVQIPEGTPDKDRAAAEGMIRLATKAKYLPLLRDPEYAPTLEDSATRICLGEAAAKARGVEGMDGAFNVLVDIFKLPAELVRPPIPVKRKRDRE